MDVTTVPKMWTYIDSVFVLNILVPWDTKNQLMVNKLENYGQNSGNTF